MYPGIEPSRHNVIQTRLNDDLEGDVRILLGKFRQEPGYQEIPDRGRHTYAQMTSRPVAKGIRRIDHVVQ